MYSFTGPAEVKGVYQKIRDLLQPVLILLFISLPWIHIHGQPAVLFDVLNRHFVFFGSTFYAHEAPLLFFLIILVVLSIFAVTAVYGRLWCGWACPQTVFLHAVFNRIDRWIFGTYSQRILFFKSETSFRKVFKITLLHGIFLAICWVLSHSLVAYFVGADTITRFIVDGPFSHATIFTVCLIMTSALYFNFTFFREKLCIYICPYGRFQNALIDNNSLVVYYDAVRGEPRGKRTTRELDSEKGDCVDCNRCVHVCPVKIDIRNGFQFDCIACGRCVDACNAVMKKINRPEHLIRYETGNQKPITLKRFRLLLYAGLILLFALGFIWSLYQRSDIDLSLSRAHQNPFSAREENQTKILQNQIQLHLKNQSTEPQHLRLNLSAKNLSAGYRLLTPAQELTLDAGQDLKTSAFVEISNTQFDSSKSTIELILNTDHLQIQRSMQFIKQE